MIVIGIDPGISGAIAVLFGDGTLASVHDMPTLKVGTKQQVDAAALAGLIPTCHAFVERSQAMPGQGVTSMFNYGRSYGVIIGILATLGIPYEEVAPQTWKAVMMKGASKEKGASIAVASKLFPHVDLLRSKDHGKSDALLIAEYGRRLLVGKEKLR